MFSAGNKINKKDQILLLQLFQSNFVPPPGQKEKRGKLEKCIIYILYSYF